MLSRPTTEQLLLDCRDELLNTIDPAVADGPAKIAVQMMENVLRNCAARAAHEVAWMHEEGAAMIAFATRVQASPLSTPEVDTTIAAHAAGASDSRHVDEACATYDLAGRAFGAALEAVMAGEGDLADQLHREGRAVLDVRLANERQIMGEWAFVGRA
ncbi:MAG: hypothetical protein ACRDZ2_10580 [Ilumatobacteraceae bacterium]